MKHMNIILWVGHGGPELVLMIFMHHQYHFMEAGLSWFEVFWFGVLTVLVGVAYDVVRGDPDNKEGIAPGF